jgi:hypothetical protein
MTNQFETPFHVYNSGGVRMYARKHVSGGYQLIKYDINLSPVFASPKAEAMVLRGEYLRNGRLFSDVNKMYAYMGKYVMHTLRHRGFVGQRFKNFARENIHDRPQTAFTRRTNRVAHELHREMFGRYI